MNAIEYLQGEYNQAKAQWWAAGTVELTEIRDRMLRLAHQANGWLGEDGLPLADQMRTLADGINIRLRELNPSEPRTRTT